MEGTCKGGLCVCVPARACVCLNKADRVVSLEEKDGAQQAKQVETLVTTREVPPLPMWGLGLLFSRGLVTHVTQEG